MYEKEWKVFEGMYVFFGMIDIYIYGGYGVDMMDVDFVVFDIMVVWLFEEGIIFFLVIIII